MQFVAICFGNKHQIESFETCRRRLHTYTRVTFFAFIFRLTIRLVQNPNK
jgi:hypothetical protein